MGTRYITKGNRTMKRGLFSNGIWHCDCDPRMPADKFQTKNGGKNHGRWFYTCQKPQPKRCHFFLWQDEAQVREEGAVLSNSRSEPTDVPLPQTPKKIGTPVKQTKLPAQLPTPSTKTRSPVKLEAIPPPTTSPSPKNNFDDWPSDADADADLAEALDEFETPRKAARNSYEDSPSKKCTTSTSAHSHASSTTITHLDDPTEVFTTPSTSKKVNALSFTPSDTSFPTPTVPASSAPTDPGPLALSVLSLLTPTTTNPLLTDSQTKIHLTQLLNTHELRSAGISKGRDIARLALQTKDRKIAELEGRIRELELEKETMRGVVRALKGDIRESKERRGRKSKGGETKERVAGQDNAGKQEEEKAGGWERGAGRGRGRGYGRGNRSVI